MSLDARHLLEYVIRPTLRQIGLYSRSAERLVLGTAAVESDLRFLRQHRDGPARGLWQMEPATYDSLWADLLALPRRSDLRLRVLSLGPWSDAPPADRMVTDLALGAAMCRIRYLWDPHMLPQPDEIRQMAETWCRAYNTFKGKGTIEGYMSAWRRHCSPIMN